MDHHLTKPVNIKTISELIAHPNVRVRPEARYGMAVPGLTPPADGSIGASRLSYSRMARPDPRFRGSHPRPIPPGQFGRELGVGERTNGASPVTAQ